MLPSPATMRWSKQRRLEAGLLASAGARQHGGIECVAERLGAKPFQQRLVVELGARHELHRAEAARIVEGDGRAGRHVKHDVVVRDVLFALVIIAAELLVVFLKDMKRAGHAEMHDQHVAGRQIGEQIFGAPADAGDGLALEPLREILRQRPAQIAAANLDLDEALRLPWPAARPRRTVSTSGSSGIDDSSIGAAMWLISNT